MHRAAGEPWAGFWRLGVEKAPTGELSGVDVKLDGALPQWVTLDPAQPVKVTPLSAGAAAIASALSPRRCAWTLSFANKP